MTTQVIIRSPSPNHENVKVELDTPHGKVLHKVLTDGEETTLYVYQGQRLVISEEPKVAPMLNEG